MIAPLVLAALAAAYDGRAGAITVELPRLEETVEVDGRLSEETWSRAARLTGFSSYAPTDDGPADEETEVLVFYSPTALHLGIKAKVTPGTLRATLAQRDKLATEDRVEFFLSTFNDAREAQYFAVNPLGVQADGVIVEAAAARVGFFGELSTGRQDPDLAPDFVFDSRGSLTEYGYEVEVRIPFKSLRFPGDQQQTWRLHVTRRREFNGHEDTWAPAKRAAASFLAQAGTLTGLHDLRRGLVLDLTPEATSAVDGAADGDGWGYDARRPQVGGTARWGVTSNLTLTATANPDFSQVEADASELSFDPRSAVFIAEKRPFFLDGAEQLQTPNRLIYTRRIVDPLAAVKLTGKVSGTNVAFVSAVDSEDLSRTGDDHPWFNILRIGRDLGTQNRVSLVYTDRTAGEDSNRVVAADSRLTFGTLWTLQLQGAWSSTHRAGESFGGPLWEGVLNRNGRRVGLRYAVTSLGEDFRTESGFIGRGRISRINLDHRYTLFGRENGFLERLSTDVVLDGLWKTTEFPDTDPLERKLHIQNNAVLRGGWRAGVAILIERFDYDEELYADYRLQGPDGTVLPFTGVPYIHNLDYVVSLNTPRFKKFSAGGFWLFGRDENFPEWSPADIQILDVSAEVRPTERLRMETRYQLQQYVRRSDHTRVALRSVPRLKIEYQVRRSIAVRVVGEWDANEQDVLRDDSRTNLPVLLPDPETGLFVPTTAYDRSDVRADVLFSWQPSPGTVFFAGYGNRLEDPSDGRGLRRRSDGFFVKLSYLFRM